MRILFNLRNSRLLEFAKLDPWGSIPSILSKLWVWVRQDRLPKEVIKQRYRTCRVCPFYDWEANRCFTIHPHTEEELGCGCYVPYKIQVDQDCWAKEQNIEGFGWSKMSKWGNVNKLGVDNQGFKVPNKDWVSENQ